MLIGFADARGAQKNRRARGHRTVEIDIGHNQWAQGDNTTGYASYWHLPKSTLEVDGEPVVENGQLK